MRSKYGASNNGSSRQRERLFTFLFLITLHLIPTPAELEAGLQRGLLQSSRADRILVETSAELRTVFESLEEGQRIILNTEELQLTETLIIDVAGVTLRGRQGEPTLLRCPESGIENALVIRAGNVSVADVEFRGCQQGSAVVIEPQSGDREATMSVSFHRARFVNNGRSALSGGAVGTVPCSTAACPMVSLFFSECRFRRNSAVRGGAIFAVDAELDIRDSVFRENEASVNGGAIHFQNSQKAGVKVRSTTFRENLAGHAPTDAAADYPLETLGRGGALYIQDAVTIVSRRSVFIQNRACRGGGAMAVSHSELTLQRGQEHVFKIVNSEFIENSAFCRVGRQTLRFNVLTRVGESGGALLYDAHDETPVSWLFQNSSFRSNRALSGGAVSLRTQLSTGAVHRMVSCSLEDNAALISGGCLFVQTGTLSIEATNLKNCRSIYGGGVSTWFGGDINFTHSVNEPAAVSHIDGCTAMWGGGIMVGTEGRIDLAALIIRNNTAHRGGGAARIDDSSRPLVLRGVVVESNRALVGGGLSIVVAANITITSDGGRRSLFVNNYAAFGGGIHYDLGKSAYFMVFTVTNTDFIGNKALSADSPEVQTLLELDREYSPVEEMNGQISSVGDEVSSLEFLSFLSDSSPGNGGGICITLETVRPFAVIENRFTNLFMADNEAVVGGGMSLYLAERNWNQGNRDTCFPSAFGIDRCNIFAFHNVTAQRNIADYAGGIFLSQPDGLAISCGPGEASINPSQLAGQDLPVTRVRPFCSDISNNLLANLSAGVSGADAATRVAYLAVEGWDGPLMTVASGEPLRVPCESSTNASCSRDLRIHVKDIFNQTIVTGISDARLDLALVSHHTVGDARYTAVNGVALINNTRAWGIGVKSSVTIVNERDPRIRLQLQFSTRGCDPGEADQGEVCTSCPPDQYGFDPALGQCEGCEPNAECQGGAALVPVEGYWHSTPFSPVFRKCVQAVACSYEGRQESLNGFYNDTARLKEQLESLDAFLAGSEPEPVFLDYPQCREEYEGPLCGSCKEGHGHSFSGTCERCPDRPTNGFLLFLAAAWVFVLIGINCLVTLLSTDARVEMVRQEQLTSQQSAPPRTLRRAQHIRNVECIPDRALQGTESGDSHLQSVFASQLLVTVQLTETLKILINYLQVTSTALRLQTDWNGLLRGLLRIEAGASGLPSEAFSAPYECNFEEEDGTPPSISALWMRLVTPWLVLTALLLTCVLVWLLRRLHRIMKSDGSRSSKCHRRPFLTSLIVVSIVSMYFSYIDVVRELLRAVNCIEIEESSYQVAPGHPYLDYAIEQDSQRLWAEDTAMVCFKGRHLPVGIVGVVGLVMSLCGIISIALWLPLHQKRKTEPDFIARYWFLYQSYRSQWYTNAWESVILSRKVLIAAVVVFSVHLGPMLQAVLCAGIVTTAHALHSLFSPFKTQDDLQKAPSYEGEWLRWLRLPQVAKWWSNFNNTVHLNTMESASLACSAVMFFLAAILEDNNSSSRGKTAMVSFTFAVNAVFLVYMLYRLYSGLHLLLDLKLELKDPVFMTTFDNGLGLPSLLKKSMAITRVWTSKIAAEPVSLELAQESAQLSTRDLSLSV